MVGRFPTRLVRTEIVEPLLIPELGFVSRRSPFFDVVDALEA